jgi:hypothetical protein
MMLTLPTLGRIAFTPRRLAREVGRLVATGTVEPLRLWSRAGKRRLALAFAHAGLFALPKAACVGSLVDVAAVVALNMVLERALVGQDDPAIVVGVLEIVLRHDAVAGGRRISAKRQILLVDLMGRAAQPHTRAVAVEGLVAALMVVVMMMVLTWLAMLASAPSAHVLNPL